MTDKRPPIILASGSPRRRDLLAGLNLDFEIIPADIDESVLPGEAPAALVERLSVLKAKTVADAHPDALVLAADTVVVLDGSILGKPVDKAENEAFIKRLAGRKHEVYTGHALLFRGGLERSVQRTEVHFRDLTDEEITAYVATGEGLDKAGGYAIQGYGAALIPHINGDYFNVVGLSVATIVVAAARLGVRLV